MNKKNLVIALVITGFSILLNPIIRDYDFKSLHLFQRSHSPHPEIVILAIDNQSVNSLGRWPWSRNLHSQIISKLDKLDIRAMALDVNFPEASTTLEDNKFTQVLNSLNHHLILPVEPVYFNNSNQPDHFIQPIPEFLTTRVSLGHTSAEEGPDHTSSIIPHKLIAKDGSEYYSFSSQIAKTIQSDTTDTNNNFLELLDFAGPTPAFPTYSVQDFLSGKIPDEYFRDKIVLIGATAADLHDIVQKTPVGALPGVEWHADVLDNLLSSRSEKIPPTTKLVLYQILIIISFFLVISISRSRYGFLLFLAYILAVPAVSFIAWQIHWAIPYLSALIWILSIFVLRSFYRWYLTEKEKNRLKQNFKNYFSPQVMDLVLKHPHELALGGERREITILFSDIRGFTQLVESMDPEVMSRLLSEYFTQMTEEVMATDGVLDKFIGDAVMAFWGAPIDQPDQADRAVQTAIRMMSRLKTLHQKWRSEGLPELNIGIGINSGEAIVGNMGSEKRFDYTVIGDSVNAASRLESLNKEYDSNIIISESTKNRLSTQVQAIELGEVKVKGKNRAIKIYKIID